MKESTFVGQRTRDRPPIRIVHLGLGAFHRAHQAWYTQCVNDLTVADGDTWGIAAFTGRNPRAADALSSQDDLYVLIERGSDGDNARLVESLSLAVDGRDAQRWRDCVADPAVAVISLTITEAGYRLNRDGMLDLQDPLVAADLVALRSDPEEAVSAISNGGMATAPARLVDGLRARMSAQLRAGRDLPIAVVSCDNLARNGVVAAEGVRTLARLVDPQLERWIERHVSFVSSVVDRITPATTRDDANTAESLTGIPDRCPVVTEPFSEWIMCGSFPAGRPAWELVGVRFVDDIAPYEMRKLWLLNAGHSLLSYLGLLRGYRTIAETMADPACRYSLEALWVEARAVLPLGDDEVYAAISALRERFENPRIEHRLQQIAVDGSRKLPLRVTEVIHRRIENGFPPGEAHAEAIAAWALYLGEAERNDPLADDLAERIQGVLDDGQIAAETIAFLDDRLVDHQDLRAAVTRHIARLRNEKGFPREQPNLPTKIERSMSTMQASQSPNRDSGTQKESR